MVTQPSRLRMCLERTLSQNGVRMSMLVPLHDVRNILDWATDKQLDDDALDNLIALVGQNFVPKLRGLDAVAGKKGMDKQLARDTLTYKEWDTDPKLQVIDTGLSNAPKWAMNLNEGDRRT